MCIDSNSYEPSFATQNSCSAGAAVTVSIIDYIDWTVAGSVAIDDSTVRPGQSIALGATVRNVGNQTAGATTLRFYWSTDSSISTTDTQLCTAAVPSLDSDASSALSAATCAVPASATAGDYYVGACVDTQSESEESRTDNNCSAGVAVGIDNFDWTVAGSVSIDDATLKQGQSIALGAIVRNVGGVAAGATTTLRFYWSTDSSISTTDTQLCTAAVPSLDSDSGSTLSAACAVPAAAEDGDYHVGACVDTQSEESRADNNCSDGVAVRVSAFDWTVAPDSVSIDDSGVEQGQSITLAATARNVGGASAGATTLRFYWSTDSSIETTDTQLCAVAVPSLDSDSGSHPKRSLRGAGSG